MRWFKHMADMRNDLFTKQLIQDFGLEGYAMWTLLLEVYADNCGNNPGEFVTFEANILRKELHISAKKLEQFLHFCSEKGKLLCNFFQKNIEISMPKMASLKDNYTKDLQGSCKQLAHKNIEGEGEEEIRSSSPTPSSPPDDADDFSENKLALAPNAGVYFQIDNRGDQLSEEEWLYRCFLQRRRDKKLSTVGCDSLTSLLSLYPNHYEQYRRWVTLPVVTRMTAFALTYVKASPDDPFKYACWIVENKSKVPDWQSYYAITERAVSQNDLKVSINA